MDKKTIYLSYFAHVWEKKSSVITLDALIADIRGQRWSVLTDNYRRLKVRPEKQKEAEKWKRDAPAITVGGVFGGGHATSQLKELSGLMMVDLDHTDKRTGEIVALLSQLPYVVAAFVSISGSGVKGVVRIPIERASQYADIYRKVAAEVELAVGFACDRQCSDLGRLCYCVCDPQAYYNPGAEEFPREKLIGQGLPLSGSEAPYPDSERGVDPDNLPPLLLEDFCRRNPFVKGERHSFVLKLGRTARYKGFSTSQLSALSALAVGRLSATDFTAAEIEKTLFAGYEYVSSMPAPENPSHYAHYAQRSPLDVKKGSFEGEDEEELSEKSEELREQAPYFPQEVYTRLPDLLTRGLGLGHTGRERDMLLMSMLVNVGACLPGAQVMYGQMYYSLHFYFAAVAPAGTGKGVMALAAYLPNATHAYYEQQNEVARKEYDQAMLAWEQEVKEAARQKRAPSIETRPKEPCPICVKVSPNLSKSRLILHLKANGKLGVVINASEMDMVSNAMKQDCGKHDDVFRAAAHHEDVSSSYKIDREQIVVHDPRLALCLSGTPGQLVGFIGSLENGMYSRLALYTAQSQWQWRSAAPQQGQTEHRTFFRALGEELLQMHLWLSQSPTEVVFTPTQWETHTAFFSALLGQTVSEGGDSYGAIVLRHGLLAARIAAILTLLRKCEAGWNMSPYTCTDQDFDTALCLTRVLIEHSLLLSSSLNGAVYQAKPLKSFYRARPILDALPRVFLYTDYMRKASEHELPDSTARRFLNRLVKKEVLVKEDGKYRKTLKSWSE